MVCLSANNTDDIFDLRYEEVRHGQKAWRVYRKWDNLLIKDICFHCAPHNHSGAKVSLDIYVERVMSGEIKGNPQIKDKIIEYYLLINE